MFLKPEQRPEAIDTRVVLRVYAWVTIMSGLLVYLWPAALLPYAQFPNATPASPWRSRVSRQHFSWQLGHAQPGWLDSPSPLARHRSLYAFALAHLMFGGLFIVQWVAIFDVILPPLVGSSRPRNSPGTC